MKRSEFIGQLVLVFIGATLALLTQEWNKARVDRNDAIASSESVRRELSDNLTRLSETLKAQREREEFLTSSEVLLGKETFAAPGLDQRAQQVALNAQKREIFLGLRLVAYRRTAWEIAVARGEVKNFSTDEALRFGRAYSRMQETTELMRGPIVQGQITRHVWVIDMFTRGESKDALQFARSIRELSYVYRIVDANLVALQKTIEESLARAPDKSASAPSQ